MNGVQLQNSDINGDKKFDFQDTQMGLNFLQGIDIGFNGYLSEIMRIVPKSEYDGTTTSNWSTQTTYSPSTSILFGIKDTLQTLEYKVSFLGDVNLSHSVFSNNTNNFTIINLMSVRNSSTQNNTLLEVNLDIEQSEEHIIVTLDLPENNFNLVGSEFRIGFDNTRLEYDKLETTTTMNTFDAKRETYLKIGSISVDGSQNLNGGVQYKIYFKSTQTFDSTLGLVSVKKSEVVDSKTNRSNNKMKKLWIFILLILLSCPPDELMVVEPYPQYEMIFEETESSVTDGQEISFEILVEEKHWLIISDEETNSVVTKESFLPLGIKYS